MQSLSVLHHFLAVGTHKASLWDVREHLLFGIIIFMAFLSEVFSGGRLDLTLWPAVYCHDNVVLLYFSCFTCSKNHSDRLTESFLSSTCSARAVASIRPSVHPSSTCLSRSGSLLFIRKNCSSTAEFIVGRCLRLDTLWLYRLFYIFLLWKQMTVLAQKLAPHGKIKDILV